MWGPPDASLLSSLDVVLEYLEARLADCAAREEHRIQFLRWARRLRESIRGGLLMTSIAIDVRADAVPIDTFVEIVNWWPYAEAFDPCLHLANALTQDVTKRYICISRHQAEDHTDNDYVRIVELGSFIEYFVRPNTGSNLTHDEVWDLWESFKEEGDLSGFERWWCGGRGRTWVLPLEEYHNLDSQKEESNPGTVFFDSLGIAYQDGFGRKHEPFALAMVYPPRFKRAGCSFAQPTALDANWASDAVFYVSSGKADAWGRTKSCIGAKRECRERVHGRFKPLTPDFKVIEIGSSAPMEVSDGRHVLHAALERFMRVVVGA